ncbi:hypothetical protein G6F57_018787 [Rhizopus arrhizus]|nr:hypothetical protein G6F57_018787 [Rhizopus arrhizus]
MSTLPPLARRRFVQGLAAGGPQGGPGGRAAPMGAPAPRNRLRGCAWARVGPAPAGAGQAAALLTFDIAPAPLNQVLTRLANESGILLAAPRELLAGRQSGGVRGRYSRAEALDQALAGTGLRATREAPNQYRLVAIPETGTAVLEAVTVTGSALSSGLPPVRRTSAMCWSTIPRCAIPIRAARGATNSISAASRSSTTTCHSMASTACRRATQAR